MAMRIQDLPATGFLRLPQIIGSRKTTPPTIPIIPVSRSTWLDGVRTGKYPAPVKGLGKRITVWRVEDIIALIDRLSGDATTTVDATTALVQQNKGDRHGV
jgi:prophage regulatory protein